MPNKIKKLNKREEELKALGVYPENPDDTTDPLDEEPGMDAVFSTEDSEPGDEEDEE